MPVYPDDPGFVRTAIAGTHTPLRFARNGEGRDFVVGDIHGQFATLDALLEAESFDPGRDRLFSVGDLVDRGVASGRALEWVEEVPWFHAIRGNHEQLLLDSGIDENALDIWMMNGGEWWDDESDDRRRRFHEAFARLPFAMEIATATGTVGIIHADIPTEHDWESMCEALRAGDREAVCDSMWLRERCYSPRAGSVRGGVDRIYSGHTMMTEPTSVGNVHYIDTGAGRRDQLTLVEIHPERHRTRSIAVID